MVKLGLVANLKRLGPYVFERELGRGPLGTVYLASQGESEPSLAVKVLSSQVFPDSDVAKLFQRDSQPAYSLRHRHLVEVLEQGYDEGKHYLLMEYLPGGTLQQRLQELLLPDWRGCVALMVPLLQALGYAHDNLVLHGDIHPSHIVFDQHDQAFLGGFGTVYLDGANLERSRGYLAPELLSEHGGLQPVDGRSDTFSMALILYEMLTQIQPFRHGFQRGLTRPDNIDASIPVEISDILLRALSLEREERPTATQLARQLSEALAGHPPAEKEVVASEVSQEGVPQSLAAPPAPEPTTMLLCSNPSQSDLRGALEQSLLSQGGSELEWIAAGLLAVFSRPTQALQWSQEAWKTWASHRLTIAIATGVFRRDPIWAETRPDLGKLACRNLDRLHGILKSTPSGRVRLDLATARHAPESLDLVPIDGDVMELQEIQPEAPKAAVAPKESPTGLPSLEQRLGSPRRPRPSFIEPVPSALRGQGRTMEVPKPERAPIPWNNIISLLLILVFGGLGYLLYLRMQPGELVINCQPLKVELSLDSEPAKPYKSGSRIALSAGKHQLKLSAKGFQPHQGGFTVQSKQATVLQITLKRPGRTRK